MQRSKFTQVVDLDPTTNPFGATRMIVLDLEAMRREVASWPLKLAAMANTRRHQAANKRRRHR